MSFSAAFFDHYEATLPNTVMIGSKEYPLTYFSDREEFEQDTWWKPWVKHELLEHYVAVDRATGRPAVWEQMYKSVKNDGFVVLQFEGQSNSGKSWLAFAKALTLLDLWGYRGFTGVLWLVQSWSNVLRTVHQADKGDVVFCDEETKVSGQESKTDTEALENILSACRIHGISFFFLDPDPVAKPNVQYRLKILSQARGAYYTFSLVYTPRGTLMGYDDTRIPVGDFDESYLVVIEGEPFEVNNWDELMLAYLPAKIRYVNDLILKEGIKGSDIRGRQEAHAELVYQYACLQQRKITKTQLDTWIIDLGLEGLTKDYKNQLIQRVMNMVKDSGVKVRTTGKDEHFKVNWMIEEISSDPLIEGFHDLLVPHLLKEAEKSNERKREKGDTGGFIEPFHIDFFIRWCKGESQMVIGNSHDPAYSQAQVSIFCSRISQNILGYAIEEWLAEAHPDWKHVGGNSKEPDFELPDMVVSVKGRIRDNIQVTHEDFAKSEKKKYLEEGKKLLMYYYELKHLKRFVVLEARVIDR